VLVLLLSRLGSNLSSSPSLEPSLGSLESNVSLASFASLFSLFFLLKGDFFKSTKRAGDDDAAGTCDACVAVAITDAADVAALVVVVAAAADVVTLDVAALVGVLYGVTSTLLRVGKPTRASGRISTSMSSFSEARNVFRDVLVK
jgi:hypothetical protein